jgi:hypothetical protein
MSESVQACCLFCRGHGAASGLDPVDRSTAAGRLKINYSATAEWTLEADVAVQAW